MILIKLYKYDAAKSADGYRGEDLTKYVLQGAKNHEDITQELDYSEITLLDYPDRKAFTPESRFVIDICYGDYKTDTIPPNPLPVVVEDFRISKTLHRIVKQDAVQLPVLSDQTLYRHNITFIEPSAIAQKRIVDNIAVTHKLKDVSLDTKTTYDLEEKNGFVNNTSPINPAYAYGKLAYQGGSFDYYGKRFQFSDVVKVKVGDSSPTDLKYLQVNETTTATIILPKLLVYGGISGTINLTSGIPVSIYYTIKKYDLYNNYLSTVVRNGIVETSDLSGIYGSTKGKNRTKAEFLIEDVNTGHILIGSEKNYYRKYTDETVFAKTDSDYQIPIQLQPNVKYVIEVERYDLLIQDNELNGDFFSGKFPYTGTATMHTMSVDFTPDSYASTTGDRTANIITQGNDTFTQNATIVTYTQANIQEVLSAAVPYSALNLLRKAILNSHTVEKTSGVAVGDLNHQNQTTGALDYFCPFYIDNAFETELSTTPVIESFFQNKNLWEIMVEAGNYIHAIPEIVFGDSNKFMLTFNRLGQTTESRVGGVRTSILNSQGIEDYICATNSYVDNFVQLGGEINEWVAAKTTDSSALVSNDTAEIIASKKIIELLQLEIRCNTSGYTGLGINNGAVGDATKYIYEENVYKLLSVEFNQVPNKGIAMYYTLGENKLKGGDYRLPRAKTDIYNDYAIKKLIYVALTGTYPTTQAGVTSGYWTNIRVNDFSFHLRYRTKDSVRLSHSRPDIRKFLLNSYFDQQPQHWQINNQTDTLIDSQKFGSNIYGTLLRTGNNEYTETEWITSPSYTRQKGEIRKINGEIYYVATVDNIYYNDHIESTVVYSKDYNQLSKVIGIPSEPRFYEISEQSQIRRDVSINDYFLIALNSENVSPTINSFFMDIGLINNMLFGLSAFSYPNYALTAFKGDNTNGVNIGNFGDPSLYKEVLSTVNSYSSGNTLVFEWEMVDNFSAGDQVSAVDVPDTNDADGAYSTLKAVKYTDKYGKASLFDFFLFNGDFSANPSAVKALPETQITAKQGSEYFIGDIDSIFATDVKVNDTNYNGRGLTLLKDCREKIAFNYNLAAITDSDTFITSQYLFEEEKSTPTIVCLTEEVNKFSNGTINTAAIFYNRELTENDFVITQTTNVYGKPCSSKATLKVSTILASLNDKYFSGDGGVQIHAIAICFDFDDTQPTNKFLIARNIPDPTNKVATIRNWYFGSPTAAFFTRNLA